MPYFHNDDVNILFIHVPKTGGTSVEQYFSNKYNIQLDTDSLFNFDQTGLLDINSSLQHMTYQTIMKYKDYFKININNLEIISIVRNPYERLVSDLFFYGKINIDNSPEEVYNIIKNKLYNDDLDNHNIPQYLFVTDENKKIIPDIKIFKTETLDTDMHNSGYSDFNIKYLINVHGKLDYYKYLNDDSINLINEYYHYDFILFNYQKKHY